MKRIVTYVHRYKRPARKKPKGPTIDEGKSVVQAKAPTTKVKTARSHNPAIVTSISRHDAARKHAWDRVEARDDDAVSDETDGVLSARYRNYVEAGLNPERRSSGWEDWSSPGKRSMRCDG